MRLQIFYIIHPLPVLFQYKERFQINVIDDDKILFLDLQY